MGPIRERSAGLSESGRSFSRAAALPSLPGCVIPFGPGVWIKNKEEEGMINRLHFQIRWTSMSGPVRTDTLRKAASKEARNDD